MNWENIADNKFDKYIAFANLKAFYLRNIGNFNNKAQYYQ